MSFDVGQIVYLLSKKDERVFPAQVIEEIKRKTIDEELVSYIIRLPNEDKSEVLIEQVDAEIFTSIKSLEEKMLESASNHIQTLLDKTKKLEKMFESVSPAPQAIQSDSEDVEIDLGDGLKGKLNMNELPV